MLFLDSEVNVLIQELDFVLFVMIENIKYLSEVIKEVFLFFGGEDSFGDNFKYDFMFVFVEVME